MVVKCLASPSLHRLWRDLEMYCLHKQIVCVHILIGVFKQKQSRLGHRDRNKILNQLPTFFKPVSLQKAHCNVILNSLLQTEKGREENSIIENSPTATKLPYGDAQTLRPQRGHQFIASFNAFLYFTLNFLLMCKAFVLHLSECFPS